MTSFGPGNFAKHEKRISECDVEILNNPEEYSLVSASDEVFYLPKIEVQSSGRGCKNQSAVIDNPLLSRKEIGSDLIGNKKNLEKRYFGKEYSDNIHIQLIYNILDIEKIFSVFASNINYAINNLTRNEDGDISDFVGYDVHGISMPFQTFSSLREEKTHDAYEAFVRFYNNPRLGYFGNAFFKQIKSGKHISITEKTEKRSEQNVYDILMILSELRNFCVHDFDQRIENDEIEKMGRSSIFEFDKKAMPEVLRVLDSLYNEKINSLNSFADNESKSNLRLIFDALNLKASDKNFKEVVEKYFDFALRKTHKNIGFSIKHIRELILKSEKLCYFKKEHWNNVRQKINTVIDFLILKQYGFSAESKNSFSLICRLREAKDEAEKEGIYIEEAKKLLSNGYFVSSIDSLGKNLEEILNDNIQNLELPFFDKEKVDQIAKECKLTSNVSYFTKMVYLLTLLLDGKEINDLLTGLINKIDNIASLIFVMQKEGINVEFCDNYSFFNNFIIVIEKKSGQSYSCPLLKELGDLNGFAKMTMEDPSAKYAMYEDAAYFLGYESETEDVFDYLADNMLDPDRLKTKGYIKDGEQPDHTFRNFIANNVINSWRFRYLIRYCNPKVARKLITSSTVKMVLESIPQAQIVRYCKDFHLASTQDKVGFLTEKIMGIQLNSLRPDMNTKQIGENTKNTCTLISLYLNVAYQIVKNLVNINSRYIMAFHCLERDAHLQELNVRHEKKNYCALTKKHLDSQREEIEKLRNDPDRPLWRYKQNAKKVRVFDYCEKDYLATDEVFISEFRNKVAHLNVINSVAQYINEIQSPVSYYSIYHFCVQRLLYSYFGTKKEEGCIFENNGTYYLKVQKKDIPISKHNIAYLEDARDKYNKNMVKALCVPFIYCLPRFKNLSIEALFDRNKSFQNE